MEQELEQRMEQLPSLYVINDRLSTFLTPHESKMAFVQRSHYPYCYLDINEALPRHHTACAPVKRQLMLY